MQVEAGMIRHVQKVESRQKHCKNRCEMRHTGQHRKKNDAKWRAEHFYWTVQRAGCGVFLLENTTNTDAKTKPKFSFG